MSPAAQKAPKDGISISPVISISVLRIKTTGLHRLAGLAREQSTVADSVGHRSGGGAEPKAAKDKSQPDHSADPEEPEEGYAKNAGVLVWRNQNHCDRRQAVKQEHRPYQDGQKVAAMFYKAFKHPLRLADPLADFITAMASSPTVFSGSAHLEGLRMATWCISQTT